MTEEEARAMKSVVDTHGPAVPVSIQDGGLTLLNRNTLSLCKGSCTIFAKGVDVVSESTAPALALLDDAKESVSQEYLVRALQDRFADSKQSQEAKLCILAGGGVIVYRYNKQHWSIGVIGMRMTLEECFVSVNNRVVRWSDKTAVDLVGVKPEDNIQYGALVDELELSVVVDNERYVLRRGGTDVHAGVVGGFSSAFVYVKSLWLFKTKSEFDAASLLYA